MSSKTRYKTYPFEVSIIGVKNPIVIMASNVDDVYNAIKDQSNYESSQIVSITPVFSTRKGCF